MGAGEMERGETGQVSSSVGEGRGSTGGRGVYWGRESWVEEDYWRKMGGVNLAQLPCFVLTASLLLLSLLTHSSFSTKLNFNLYLQQVVWTTKCPSAPEKPK